MRQLLVVEQHVAVQPRLQLLTGFEMVALQQLLYAAVEPLDHAADAQAASASQMEGGRNRDLGSA